ncbi:hypothetical protein FPV67DRAFT_1454792 [Lyophyllum atratum]|nr:hypothetical protein FPV67DRAFT_1454792 [Lyophyllum atratum]
MRKKYHITTSLRQSEPAPVLIDLVSSDAEQPALIDPVSSDAEQDEASSDPLQSSPHPISKNGKTSSPALVNTRLHIETAKRRLSATALGKRKDPPADGIREYSSSSADAPRRAHFLMGSSPTMPIFQDDDDASSINHQISQQLSRLLELQETQLAILRRSLEVQRQTLQILKFQGPALPEDSMPRSSPAMEMDHEPSDIVFGHDLSAADFPEERSSQVFGYDSDAIFN